MPSCHQRLSLDQCNDLLSKVNGLRIADVGQSVEPVLLMELGRLHERPLPRCTCREGQVSLLIESDWRFEKPRSIHFGSGFSQRVLDRRLPELVGLHAVSLAVEPETREIRMQLSDGRTFRTFSDWDTQPRWTVFFNDGSLFPLDAVWHGVDVTPCIHVTRGSPEVEFDFDDANADLATLKRRYRFAPQTSS